MLRRRRKKISNSNPSSRLSLYAQVLLLFNITLFIDVRQAKDQGAGHNNTNSG